MTATINAGNSDVYARLGAVVRDLHAALQALGADGVLAEAASEFPSARERLLHVGKLTEQAANTVLNKVEETFPLQEHLYHSAQQLADAWASVAADDLPEPVAKLTGQTSSFFGEAKKCSAATRENLSSMMMAQDFQDLTGQLIIKVVNVLARTENDLLRLLIDAAPPGTVVEEKKVELMAGPAVPGSTALAQDDVDDLLADLGF